MNVRLRVVRGRPAGKELTFGPGDYYLGRGPECQVRFNSDLVSRQHCLMRVGPGGATLRDLHSRNGTLVNGALLTAEHALRSGDRVQIGPMVFEVELTPRTAAVPTRAGEAILPEVGRSARADESTKQQPNVPEAEA
jgi:pSer/pThr/pTyr-binding forkhead associated (FHA) protein